MFTELLLLLVSVVLILYFVIKTKYGYWKRNNLPGPVPTFFGGNIGAILTGKVSIGDVYTEIYRKYKNKYPFVGIYKFFSPAVLVTDLDVVKEVLIKDFANYGNNAIAFTNEGLLLSKNPFVLKFNEWKPARQQIITLVSSSKLKTTVGILNESAQGIVNFINRQLQKTASETVTLDAKEVATRCTTNNVSKWVFGVDDENFADEPSELYKTTNDLFKIPFIQNLSFFIVMFFPSLLPYVDARLLSPIAEKRIVSIIQQSVEHRLKNNIDSNDLLGTLIALKKSGSITDKELIGNVGSVFLDGIEASSIIFHYVLYELAANPHAQETLRREINETLKTSENDVISLETIQGMKFLDAVFNETLRLNSIIYYMDRKTTKRTTLRGRTNDGQEIKVDLEADTSIVVPVRGLHMDETYFPEATAFKPERFYGENKNNIPKCSFLPFGEGPRICPGKLFGTYQAKTGVMHIIKNFKLSLADGTSYPVEIDPTAILATPKVPIKLNFQAAK